MAHGELQATGSVHLPLLSSPQTPLPVCLSGFVPLTNSTTTMTTTLQHCLTSGIFTFSFIIV